MKLADWNLEAVARNGATLQQQTACIEEATARATLPWARVQASRWL